MSSARAHFPRLPLSQVRRTLTLGCGTGVEVRAIRALTGRGTSIVGVDHSEALLDVARRLTAAEGLADDNVTYRAGDAHEEKLMQLILANPRVMRDLPRLLGEADLELVEADGQIYADIGIGSFWLSAAESYGALLARAEVLPKEVIEDWRTFQAKSVVDGTFFAASNYYTYIIRRPADGRPPA